MGQIGPQPVFAAPTNDWARNSLIARTKNQIASRCDLLGHRRDQRFFPDAGYGGGCDSLLQARAPLSETAVNSTSASVAKKIRRSSTAAEFT
jgi:hypothetical protein